MENSETDWHLLLKGDLQHAPGHSSVWEERIKFSPKNQWEYCHDNGELLIEESFDAVEGLYGHLFELDRLELDRLSPLECPWPRVTQFYKISKIIQQEDLESFFAEYIGDLPDIVLLKEVMCRADQLDIKADLFDLFFEYLELSGKRDATIAEPVVSLAPRVFNSPKFFEGLYNEIITRRTLAKNQSKSLTARINSNPISEEDLSIWFVTDGWVKIGLLRILCNISEADLSELSKILKSPIIDEVKKFLAAPEYSHLEILLAPKSYSNYKLHTKSNSGTEQNVTIEPQPLVNFIDSFEEDEKYSEVLDRLSSDGRQISTEMKLEAAEECIEEFGDVIDGFETGSTGYKFHVCIHNYGPVYWISAVEFDNSEYFESCQDALDYAMKEFESFAEDYE